ncbi:YdcF family protein [Riemerella anatipestifer]|nr:YdcF family protein [Riemerella anatipestifer]WPC14317.1 YdcF family protein [Riemerella anatipestifer]WPC16475.1 YdcF family protein [Riemerella anatipestifer]
MKKVLKLPKFFHIFALSCSFISFYSKNNILIFSLINNSCFFHFIMHNGFKYRIDAAAELYKNGKVQYFIVSGDNSRKDYNETEDMKLDLMAHGIPENHIYQDFAGFRTLDSVIRAEDIFGQKTFIIILQKFHNERAVYLARKNGLEAYGYNAQDVNAYAGFKTQLREYFARVKVFYDLLLGVEPKYSGDKIEI